MLAVLILCLGLSHPLVVVGVVLVVALRPQVVQVVVVTVI
jgi:hypothetical protein